MKQDDIIVVDIIDYGANGEGIAKEDGFVIFIPFAMKNEKVKVKIKYVKKSFATAELIEVILPSELRIQPPCNRFGRCGGCDLLNMEYAEQLRIKKQALINTLKKNTGIELPVDNIVPSPKILGYRNKAQLPFGIVNGKVAAGFFEESTHKIVSITKCFLHGDWLEKLLIIVLDFANKYNLTVYDETSGKGFLRHLVARFLDEQLSVVLVVNGERLLHAEELIGELSNAFENFSLYLSVNKEKTNVIMGNKLIALKESIMKINVQGISLTVNPMSFLQVNDEIREAIYNKVLEKAKNSDIVIDAFSGVGLIGAMLAKAGVKKVYDIEIVPEAIEDAKILAKDSGIEDKVTHILGDVAEELPKLINELMVTETSSKDIPKITIILDPPRKGVDVKAIDALRSLDIPLNLIYISCNPATLSRDLALLSDKYKIESITPFDMFANTKHLETLVCLTKNR